jgi:hypothetical protein
MDYNQLDNRDLSRELQAQANKLKSEQNNLTKLQMELESALPKLAIGGMEDINKIIWPFVFSSEAVEVGPNQVRSSFIGITQEAGFVVTRMVKTVFEKLGVADYEYLDPRKDDGTDLAQGLSFTLTDSQSTRTFHQNPIAVDHIGDYRFPYKMVSPQLIMPNNNIEVKWFNDHATKTYIPRLSLIGYRIRIEDAQKLLSLVTR